MRAVDPKKGWALDHAVTPTQSRWLLLTIGWSVSSLNLGAAAIVLAEEAIVPDRKEGLIDWLNHQPTWSDMPVLIIARPGADSAAIAQAIELLGNGTVLERPTIFKPLTARGCTTIGKTGVAADHDAKGDAKFAGLLRRPTWTRIEPGAPRLRANTRSLQG